MGNNYIKLINRFWTASIEHTFTTADCTLYFYLLNTCNMLHWKQPFRQSDRYLSLVLGISVPTVRRSKLRLKKRGLIDFSPPKKASKSFDGQTKYQFPNIPERKKRDGKANGNSPKGPQANNRKSEIIRLANEATTACS